MVYILCTYDNNVSERCTVSNNTSSSKLNKEFTSAYPNILYFMETLNSIQTLNYIKFRSNNTRKLNSKQKKKTNT